MAQLKRSLNLPLIVLYGLGGTIGAGIYVLVGIAAGKAGIYAPSAFILAALVMAPTAASFAELSVRYPVSAGEAAYVFAGFQSKTLALIIGLMVAASGIISAATVSIGSAGYIQVFLDWPQPLIVTLAILLLGAIVCWGITESVTFASVLTIIEIAGLLVIIYFGFMDDDRITSRLTNVVPTTLNPTVWMGVMGASVLAFFAFIGFEDIVNVAEESKSPETTLPWAIALTLVISTLLYLLVSSVAVLSVPIDELAASRSPLSIVFERTAGLSPTAISAIAIIATLNGVVIQMIMSSRVLYGLGKQGQLPTYFSNVNAITKTPLYATLIVVVIIYALAMFFPIEALAEKTAQFALAIFTLVNLALIKIKLSEDEASPRAGKLRVPIWIPILGAVNSMALFIASLF